MTSPIGPLNGNYSQMLQRIQDTARGITVPVLPGAPDDGSGGGSGGAGEIGPSFKDTFTRALNQVSETRDRSAELSERFVNGEPVELHTVMAASEEAGIALDLAIEMRNKVVEAYRSLINMQS